MPGGFALRAQAGGTPALLHRATFSHLRREKEQGEVFVSTGLPQKREAISNKNFIPLQHGCLSIRSIQPQRHRAVVVDFHQHVRPEHPLRHG